MSIVTFTMNPAVDLASETPRVEPIHKLRCTAIRRHPGGGGVNVARVVARLGGQVRAIYPVGGPIGELLRRLVDAEGVPSETIPIAQDTRENFTVDEETTGKQFRFVLPGPELTAEECAACLDKVARIDAGTRFFVASGSLPGGVPHVFIARVARAAKAYGARVAVDASGPPLASVLGEGVYLVKPNLRELQELVGCRLEERERQIAAARSLVEQGGAELIALTLGHLGALLVTRREALYAPALPIAPVSTVGAGDSFLGAMLWSLDAGHALEDAFRYGVAGGTAAVLSPGTGLCSAADVRRLYDEVRVERL